jgi:hypothetical protein
VPAKIQRRESRGQKTEGEEMKITIESTSKIVEINGVPARVWEGQTDSGIPVYCYVTRIVAPKNENLAQFERELLEQRQPSVAAQAIPLRLVL